MGKIKKNHELKRYFGFGVCTHIRKHFLSYNVTFVPVGGHVDSGYTEIDQEKNWTDDNGDRAPSSLA